MCASGAQFNDTICALATPAGGAIAVIRLSGSDAIAIAGKVVRIGHADDGIQTVRASTVHYGHLLDAKGEEIDDVMVSVFRHPHSYTGEDAVEISCHGSRYIVGRILKTLIDTGCRQAEPGEYTRRAYLNGKMDLSQAEAVADLIASTNRATHRMALSQLKGHFSSELSQLRDQLLKMTSLLELELDFSDHEELEFADRSELLQLAEKIDQRITTLARSFETGKALKQGVPVTIVGKTNVGKSTLLNKLLHEDRAIVSDIHGTTRDVIEDTTEINGIMFRFIDTAGIRQTSDKVEQLGIERTYKKIDEATIVLWLVDDMPSHEEIATMTHSTEGKKLLLVFNKADLRKPAAPTDFSGIPSDIPTLSISAKFDKNIDTLEEALFQSADIPEISENDVIVTSARHYEALTRAHDNMTRVLDGMRLGLSGDLLAEDLRLCLDSIADITGGQITPQETLNNIFKHFCVGK